MSAIVTFTKYDNAVAALAAAKSVDEVKGIRDTSEAMRAYAKQAQNKGMETDAAEIRIRAERRLGEMMAAQRDLGMMATGTAGTGNDNITGGFRTNPPVHAPPTLSEMAIGKSLADRARKSAAVPAPEFENIISDWRGKIERENERVSVNILASGEKHISRVDAEKSPDVALGDLAGMLRKSLDNKIFDALIDAVKFHDKQHVASALSKVRDNHSPLDDVATAFAAWNSFAARTGLPLCQKPTKARQGKMKGRIKDAGGLSGIYAALAKIENSDFLMGLSPSKDQTPFKCTIDFLLSEGSFAKIMEGNYANRAAVKSQAKQISDGAQEYLEDVARRNAIAGAA